MTLPRESLRIAIAARYIADIAVLDSLSLEDASEAKTEKCEADKLKCLSEEAMNFYRRVQQVERLVLLELQTAIINAEKLAP